MRGVIHITSKRKIIAKIVPPDKIIENARKKLLEISKTAGPAWGMQRNFNKISLLFNLVPQYYFDRKGNDGFYPLMLEFNIGYILSNKYC